MNSHSQPSLFRLSLIIITMALSTTFSFKSPSGIIRARWRLSCRNFTWTRCSTAMVAKLVFQEFVKIGQRTRVERMIGSRGSCSVHYLVRFHSMKLASLVLNLSLPISSPMCILKCCHSIVKFFTCFIENICYLFGWNMVSCVSEITTRVGAKQRVRDVNGLYTRAPTGYASLYPV